MHRILLTCAVFVLITTACGESSKEGPPEDGGMEGPGPQDGGTGGDGGTADTCERFGHFGVPASTFTLPGPNSKGELYIPDVQARFPAVDWSTLDRLYVVAGNYTLINLGNLPARTAARPLIITNQGGQVVIRPPAGSTQGYIWSMGGGANWILTGRYDPDSGTGHADFPGHRCGAYATSRSRYGFLSDDVFLNGGHMGLGIGQARSFEVEFVEITRAGFAGLRINQSATGGTVPPLDGIRLHDLYIHDTASEAIYFGSTQGAPTPLGSGLKVYNNRLVRTGTESLQVQNLGDGAEVHHNVFAYGALDWRAAFQMYQDNNSQAQVRGGLIHFHHNVFLGGAAALLNFFAGSESGDAPLSVKFSDNYFADTLNLGIYVGGTSGPDAAFLWERNAFRGLDFGYTSIYPSTTDPGVVFRLSSTINSPTTLKDNVWEGSRKIVQGITGGSGSAGKVTATGNVNGPVPVLQFVASGLPAGTATRQLEMWTDKATLAADAPEVTYAAGSLVMHDGQLYRARSANTNKIPPSNLTVWEQLPLPVDDLRTAPGTEWSQRGVGLLSPSP
ncbi:carbohydrate-binding protein [Stigmatella sp. ncwal1]|uniref:Carbohydrate-binding protein n=1 Tax=Stigmatella ashevillensis TaxID=2995309 RepID=A0ABT5D3P8_9BACT|nr:carbohydrate-binding protein [Stigmatella ashevillena]MDC0708300.1 carbohydrate-binding protein [Stigmatella ashevillena]